MLAVGQSAAMDMRKGQGMTVAGGGTIAPIVDAHGDVVVSDNGPGESSGKGKSAIAGSNGNADGNSGEDSGNNEDNSGKGNSGDGEDD